MGCRAIQRCFTSWLLLLFMLLGHWPTQAKAQGSGAVFVEAAAAHGLDLDGIKDGGFAFEDLNADGYLDLVVNTDQDDADHRTRMYRSSGPPAWTFTDITATHCAGCIRNVAPDAAPERSLVFADVNHDGYPDFARNSARRLEIFLNKGPSPADGDLPFSFGDASQNPNFERFTWNVNLANPAQGIPNGMNTEGLGWLDYDQDGDLDLFVENHNWGMEIYENSGFASGVFFHATPNTASRGLPITATTGDYAAVADINDDGLVDALARKQDQQDFFLNSGGFFNPVLSFNQQANNDNKGGAAFHDMDNDGDFDLVWTENDSNRIWLQAGLNSGIFQPTDEPWASAGLVDPFDGSIHGIDGLALGDVDNDGDMDLFLSDDTSASYLFLNRLIETGSLAFERNNLGIAVNADAEGANFVDFDADGDLDLYINIRNGPNQLWINGLQASPAGEKHLYVRVLENRDAGGALGAYERDALGTTLRLLRCDGSPVSGIKEVNGGYGHGNQESRRVHFGLPDGPNTEYLLDVHYPDFGGTRTLLQRVVRPADLAPGAWLTVRPQDGSETCNAVPLARDDSIALCPGADGSLLPLANDADPDGALDPGSFSILAGPFQGSAAYDPTAGILSYSADPAASGLDSIRYRICDDASPAACAEAWIRIGIGGSIADNALLQNPFCAGFSDGAIALGPTGPFPPFSFSWSTGDTTAGLVGLVAGSYHVAIADALGCIDSFHYTLVEPDSLILSTSVVPASGPGSCDGSASVSISGGTPPYSVVWSPGGETDTLLMGLCAGSYSVLVTDAKGCDAHATVLVGASGCSLTLSLNATDNPCFGFAEGSISSTLSGGTPPYQYLWLPSGDTLPDLDSLSAGTYALLVEDAEGCTVTASASVAAPDPIAFSISSTPPSGPGASDGSASVVLSGGTAPYTILWSNGDVGPFADSLAAGSYTVLVLDANGCSSSQPFVLNDPGCGLVLDLDATDPSCFGDANGSISATPSGAPGPFSYLWNTGDTSSAIVDLSAGSYSVTVTAADGCMAMADTILVEPDPLVAGAVVASPACAGETGSIALSPSGGTAPYSVLWSDGATALIRDSLLPGTYSVVLSDALGCVDSIALSIDSGSLLSASASIVQPESCAGAADGSILLLPDGGTPPYSIFWPHNGSTLAFQGDLAPGAYTALVSDAAGCSDSLVLLVPAAVPLVLNALVSDPDCASDSSGVIAVSPSGGTAPYSYSWNTGATAATLSGLPAGLYAVLVQDAEGCLASNSWTLSSSSTLSVSLLGVEPACGEANGSILANVSGSSGSLSYAWSTGASGIGLDSLGPGFYSVTVLDSVCSASASIALGSSEGPSLVLDRLDATCNAADGQAWVVASGDGPFAYLWSDGQTTDTATALLPGSYTVLVTDSNACASTASVLVGTDNDLILSTTVLPPSSCASDDGNANVVVSGGLPPYAISWSNGDLGPIADSLPAGLYTVTVVDAGGCSRSAEVAVASGFGLSLSAVVADASCGSVDGSIALGVGSGTAPYAYAWSTGDTTASISGLAPGSYSVLVTDALGCSDVLSATVDGSTGLVVALTVDAAGCSDTDGGASLSISGGLAPFSILWSTGDSTLSVDALPSGSYSVSVVDAAGCVAVDSFAVPIDCAGPPTVVRDTVATHEGVFLVIDVLVNDTDSSGLAGLPAILIPPANGTAAVLTDGSIGYSPNPGFIGLDSLQYAWCNPDGCGSAWVLIYVGIGDNPPVALPDVASTEPGVPVLIAVGENDFDPDDDVLNWVLTEAPALGVAALGSGAGDGTALYVPPPGYVGTVVFGYAVCDPAGQCDSTTVTVVIAGPGANEPLAVDDAVSTGIETPVLVDPLLNDLGGGFPLDPGSVAVLSPPSNGGFAVDPITGVITYIPNPGFVGTDELIYQVCNTAGFCSSASIVFTVGSTDNPPVALDDAATTAEGTPVLIPVLANDNDPDGDGLLPTIAVAPSQGSVTVLPDGSMLYAPNPGYSGSDAFSYLYCDAAGNCDDATVFITITGANRSPEAVRDYSHTDASVPVTTNVLSNDSDPDGDPLSISILSGPSVGSVSIGSGGSLTYTPSGSDYPDSLQYTACDPDGACDTAWWIITVGNTSFPPVVLNDSSSTLACTLVVVNLLANDVDPDLGAYGAGLEARITDPPASGEALITDDRKLVYLPPDGFTGLVEIGYEACDADGVCASAVVRIWVLPGILPPAAFDDAFVTESGSTPGSFPLANDVDPNGHDLVGPDILSGPFNGSLTVNPDGSVSYTPGAGFAGLDSAQYAVCDTVSDCLGMPRCDTAWIQWTVLDPDPDPVDSNRAPIALNDTLCTEVGVDLVVDALVNDLDPDGDALTLTLLSSGNQGTAVLLPGNLVEYRPGPDFAGGDSLLYLICDPDGLCDSAWIFICLDPGFFIPDVITPNGDGDNEAWVIDGLEAYPDAAVVIYNRWGDEVYSAQPYNNDWTGTFRDRGALPDGTYYYILTLGDGSAPIAGFVAVFR
jgi:gliding motility-associated-like protein